MRLVYNDGPTNRSDPKAPKSSQVVQIQSKVFLLEAVAGQRACKEFLLPHSLRWWPLQCLHEEPRRVTFSKAIFICAYASRIGYLNFVLPFSLIAKGSEHDTSSFYGRNEIFPLCNHSCFLLLSFLSFLKECLLNLIKEIRDKCSDGIQ